MPSQFPPDRYIDPRYVPVPQRRTGLSRSVDAATIARLRKDNARLEELVKKLREEMQRLAAASSSLPEVFQPELMRGRKLARLVRQGDTVQFMGIGMSSIYDVEGYAECLMRRNHEVPDPACSCGFYIPAKLGENYGDPRQHWVLDVEFGGKVLDCGMGALPAPARGYKAGWQRVLSVTAPTLCAHCFANAEHVCMQFDNRIEALCPKCAVSRSEQVGTLSEEKPLTWVREHLATELMAASLTDALPPELPGDVLPAWEKDYLLQKAAMPNWPVIAPGSTYTTYYPGTYSTTTSATWPASIWMQNPPGNWMQNT